MTGCASPTALAPPPADGDRIVVQGSASYRQRIALPPQAVLRVRLLAPVGAEGLAPPPLAESSQALAGRQVPLDFSLSAPVRSLAERGPPPWEARLQAEVLVDGSARFTALQPVELTRSGLAAPVQLMLRAVAPGSERLGAPARPEPPKSSRWRGAWLTFADASTFTDCSTGRRWPVAPEGDAARAERSYLQSRAAPGEPLVVQLDGHLAVRVPMEGAAREHLVVDAFVAIDPGTRCEPPAGGTARAPLLDTYWKLVEVAGQAVGPPAAGQREARLTLASQGQRAFGHSGCNAFSGRFEVDGDQLRFEPSAGTLRACVGPAMVVERELFQAMARTRSHGIEGEQLTLRDGSEVLARFVAVALR